MTVEPSPADAPLGSSGTRTAAEAAHADPGATQGADPFAELEQGFVFLVRARRRARVRAAGRRSALAGALLGAALMAAVVLGSVPQVPAPPT